MRELSVFDWTMSALVVWARASAMLDGTIDSRDALLVDGDEGVGSLHPEVGFGIFGLVCVGVQKEQAEVSPPQTMTFGQWRADNARTWHALLPLELDLPVPRVARFEELLEAGMQALRLASESSAGEPCTGEVSGTAQ